MRSSRPALGVLASGSLRLRVEAIDGRAGFITHVADGERHWPAASVPNLPIGGGIDIMAETVAADGDRLRLAAVATAAGRTGSASTASGRPPSCPALATA